MRNAIFGISFLMLWQMPAEAQVCRLSVAGLNQARRVTGQVHVECPDEVVHTPPFGNWGVTSNYGQKRDSHQFDGWCHDTRVCDNGGACQVDCVDGWYEWNSCTDHTLYKPPNCTLYNAANCMEQQSPTGINVHGTKTVDVPVRCPMDTNNDGIPDQGGCKDVPQYATGTNFMSMYELDPICCDQLVQTVYFPPLTIPLSCDVFGCTEAFSGWADPSGWDSPATPAKVFAQMGALVNWGAFVDETNACRLAMQTFNVVSAASYQGPGVAPESIASAFGNQLAPTTLAAVSQPLPISLGGVSVIVKDRNNVDRAAPLFYISPGQVNFEVPPGTAAGAATASIFNGTVLRSTARIQVDAVAPAVFSQNANGQGVAAAVALRYPPSGAPVVEPVFTCGATAGSCVPAPINLGSPLDRAYLLLFGTGIRNRSTLTAVSAVVGGAHARVEYAGAQSEFTGLDQVNVVIPVELAGRGLVDVMLTVDGKPANTVQIAIR